MFFPTSPSSGGGSSDSITESMTINIPADFPNPYDAVASFVGKVIAEGVIITLQAASGIIEINGGTNFSDLNVDLTKFEMHGEPVQYYIINSTGAAVVLNEGEDGGYYVSLGISDITGLEVGDLICLQAPQPGQEFGVHFRELCGMAKITSLEAAGGVSGITALFPNTLVSSGALITAGAITKFKTVFDFQVGNGFDFTESVFSKISNIGFESTTGCDYAISLFRGCDLQIENMQGTGFISVGFYGFSSYGITLNDESKLSGDIAVGNCKGFSGMALFRKSYFSGSIFANGNGHGLYLNGDSIVALTAPSYLSGNNYVGVFCESTSKISALLAEIVAKNNAGKDISAYMDSTINIDAVPHSFTAFDTTEPAINTLGNYNSIINVTS